LTGALAASQEPSPLALNRQGKILKGDLPRRVFLNTLLSSMPAAIITIQLMLIASTSNWYSRQITYGLPIITKPPNARKKPLMNIQRIAFSNRVAGENTGAMQKVTNNSFSL
jgi:hypothetical protein